MKQRDRDRMARLHGAISSIPWPNRSRTIGPRDLSRFFATMQDVIPQIKQSIMAISRHDIEDPEEELEHLEYLIAQHLEGYKEEDEW